MLIFGERNHAVADIAGGKHLEVFAETTGGTTIVGDGDNGGEVANEAERARAAGVGRRCRRGGSGNVTLEATEQG